jgi:hypothetical protein
MVIAVVSAAAIAVASAVAAEVSGAIEAVAVAAAGSAGTGTGQRDHAPHVPETIARPKPIPRRAHRPWLM